MIAGTRKQNVRADFSQVVCRALANRVGLHCSNPECRAYTSGPKSNLEGAINVGVAAHIIAASQGGPRYNPNVPEKDRRSATNGIWLCQTCAKLIDNDEARYTVSLLQRWKVDAEAEAATRVGKTNLKSIRSATKAEEELKRNHRLRDELTKAFLKSPSERMAAGPGGAQHRKFKETEFIVHKLGDALYPEFQKVPGISNWFKLETFDFYFNGIEGILNIEYVLASKFTKSWSLLPEKRVQEKFPDGFWPIKVFKTGRIPWRNIRHYDLRGDEYYPFPHLYCLYVDDGMPYEGFEYYAISNNDGYHFGLPSDAKVDLDKLLNVDPSRKSWEPITS
jgi:hypothetical protein